MSSGEASAKTQRRVNVPNPRMPEKRTLYSLFLFIMLIAYWMFVWQMERIVVTPEQLAAPI